MKKAQKVKAEIVLSKDEKALVAELREKRTQLGKLKKEMEALEEKIRPLAAKRVVVAKIKAAGISDDELKEAVKK